MAEAPNNAIIAPSPKAQTMDDSRMTLFCLPLEGFIAARMTDALAPGLYVVATPIGNLGDLSPRAADTLRRADRILAEDTRVTGKLLAHIGAKVPMSRYDDHSERSRARAIVARLGERGDRAGQRRRDAADFRSRLQAGARRARRGTRRFAHDARTVRRDRRADARRTADRPLPVPRLPARQGQGARGRDRRSRRRSARRW